ncbi:MAG: hypothetical protein ACRDJM_09885, partial [Actinomycetota bacterium]
MHGRSAVVAIAALSVLTVFAVTGGPAGAVPLFGSPVVVSGLNDSEPGIDVATDGTIYVNAIPGLTVPGPSPSHLWRSANGGASWTLTSSGLRGNFPGGGDFDIDVDKTTGALYGTDLWLGSATVSVSTNKGDSWTANPYSTAIQDRQWIATAGGGRAYHVTNQIPSGITVAASVDGGITYPTQTVAMTVTDRTGCICPPGTLIAESGGLLGDKVGVIAYTSTGGVVFARSTNGSLTFTVRSVQGQTSADTGSAFPVVANAGGNKLAAVWLEVIGSTSRIRLSTSTDWGNTWAAAKTIVSAGTSVYPWVAAKGNKIAVSLFHTAAVGNPDNVPAPAQW